MAKNDWWFKFEPDKWLTDEKLNLCSLAAQGFWLRCLCVMHKSGQHTLSGTLEQLCRLLSVFPEEFEKCVRELQETQTALVDFGNASVTLGNAEITLANKKITLTSRRLKKELSAKEKNKLRQQRFKNNAKVTDESQDRVISYKLEVNNNKKTPANAGSKKDEQEQESDLPCPTNSTQPRNHPISNFSPADAEVAETMAWLCERKNLVRLNDENEWLNVFIRCESEKIDFKTFYDWLDRKRDKSKTRTVSVNMMLSDNWIASFKAETEKPTQPPKQTDSERVRAEAKYFTSPEFLDQIKAGLPQKSEAVN